MVLELYDDDVAAAAVDLAAAVNLQRLTHLAMTMPKSSAAEETILIRLIKQIFYSFPNFDVHLSSDNNDAQLKLSSMKRKKYRTSCQISINSIK